MPAILRIGRYRFFFYSNEGEEPPHIHVQSGDYTAKFWLDPVIASKSHGFRLRELNDIEMLVMEHERDFLEAWNEYFGDAE